MRDTRHDYVDNEDFYTQYARYLKEPEVRQVHDEILSAVKLHPSLRRVVDIGCGKGNEFYYYGGTPEFYYGIDQNADPKIEAKRIIVRSDYRNPPMVKEAIIKHNLTAIVSLYSAELTKPRSVNHHFYETLFIENPTIDVIYISGIYYKAHKLQETVGETGGLTSYQTMPEIDRPDTKLFIETRAEIPCPSNMFGPCIEVHRLLQRVERFHEEPVEALVNLVPAGCRAETR